MPSVDFLVRRFARARDRGDVAAARQAWEELVVFGFDLVRQRVKSFRFPGGQPLPRDHHDDAASLALTRVLAMGAGFRGTTGAEYRAALGTAVRFACMDLGRQLLAYETGILGSLDERVDGDEHGPHDRALAGFLRDRARQADDALEAEEETARHDELLRWAIEKVDNPNLRSVLELTLLEELNGAEVAERLDISIDNVYTRRTRGVRKLEEILRVHEH